MNKHCTAGTPFFCWSPLLRRCSRIAIELLEGLHLASLWKQTPAHAILQACEMMLRDHLCFDGDDMSSSTCSACNRSPTAARTQMIRKPRSVSRHIICSSLSLITSAIIAIT